MMISKVGEKLTELISPIIEVNFMVAEVEKFPYCCYEIENEQPLMDKRGLYGFTTEVAIYVVAKSESHADNLKNRIMKALVRDNKWNFRYSGVTAQTDGEAWAYKIDYSITQFL